MRKYLGSFTVYHFHDTSATSPMRGDCPINDNEYLRDNGSNLAAYLYSLMLNDEKTFRLIEGVITFYCSLFQGLQAPSGCQQQGKNSSGMGREGYRYATSMVIAFRTVLCVL